MINSNLKWVQWTTLASLGLCILLAVRIARSRTMTPNQLAVFRSLAERDLEQDELHLAVDVLYRALKNRHEALESLRWSAIQSLLGTGLVLAVNSLLVVRSRHRLRAIGFNEPTVYFESH